MNFFEAGARVHFVGVGGIGMSGLARLALESGVICSGSDMKASELTKRLSDDGLSFSLAHDPSAIPEKCDLLVYSEAIPGNNVERLAAKKLEIPEMNYFEALGEFSKEYQVIAIAGTHGKTTTTSMLSLILMEAGLNPTVLVGSTLEALGGLNSRIGGDLFVVEACEYRRNFLPLRPHLLGVLNIDYDHVDYFKSPDDYRLAFDQLAEKSESVVWPDDFESYKGELGVPGAHNRQNAGLAASIARSMGVSDEIISKVLTRFTGAGRRFEKKESWSGADAYDDYAHHPVEVKATLLALKEKYPNKKRVAVFQPHQHSRALELIADFRGAFEDADLVIIPNIYRARDSKEEVQAMSAKQFCDELSKKHSNVLYTETIDNTRVYLDENLDQESVLIVMGAGDINTIWE